MADTLESLEIEVKHSASGAADEISAVANAINDLHSQLSKALPALKELSSSLKDIKGKVNININGGSASASGKISAEGMAQIVEGGKEETLADFAQSDIDRARELISAAAAIMKRDFEAISSAASKAGQVIGTVFRTLASVPRMAASVAKGGFEKISGAINGLKERAKEATKRLSGLFSSLKRIAFYRLIRSAIKAVTQAFQEGLQSAYAFSSGIAGESHRFAEAMDSMSTHGNTMKSQLGSAFIALLTAIAPIVNAIISLVTRLANALAQLISAFTGPTYLKAADVPKKWGKAAGGAAKAAKEWKNQLLGFDEINRLEEPSDPSGGGGGGAIDPMSMFEDALIDARIKQFVDDFKAAISAGDWQGAGELLGNKINEIFPSSEQWQTWGSKLGYGLNGAVSTLYYTLETIDFNMIGSRLAEFVNSTLEQIDFTKWGGLFVRKFTLAIDFFLGFLGTLDWGIIGRSIGDFFRGALDEATAWIQAQDWEKIGSEIWKKFKELIEGLDFDTLATSFFTFFGAAMGAAVKLIGSFFDGVVQDIKDYFKKKTEEAGGDAWEGFKKGITDALSNVVEWCKTNVVDPFLNAVKEALGIHSPSTVMADIGGNAAEGFKSGFSTKWNEFETWVNGKWDSFKTWWEGRSLPQWHISLPHIEVDWVPAGGLAKFFGFDSVPSLRVNWYANGGFPDEGSLYFAGERGPELVGTMGNRNAVANNDQIVEGIRQGVYDAVSAAMANNGTSEPVVRVYLDSREIKSGQNRLNRALGVG